MDSQLNADTYDHRTNKILSEITNSKKLMTELLEINNGARMLAAYAEEEMYSIDFNVEDEGELMRY